MIWKTGVWLGSAALSACGLAQTHKVTKPETVVRAVGVYEWTGDLAKPAASRLIPVALFIDQHLEDAGLYLARPVPFALQSGDVYQLEQAGVPKGNVELAYARHLQATSASEAYDDGWFGYGSFKPLPVPKKLPARKGSTQLAKVEVSGGDGSKPHFSHKTTETAPSSEKTDGASSTDNKTADADPDRPTMKRRGADDAGTTASSATTPKDSTPGDDPDRPTMKRRSDPGPDTTATDSPASTPAADDPDRPTLKRHSAEDAKKAAKQKTEASVTGAAGSLNEDPDRPSLHRGKPTRAMTEADLPKLSGLPVDLQQMVAVSDAANRPQHDFTRAWEDDAERAAVLAKMQGIAEAQLAAYGAPPAAAPAKPMATRPQAVAPRRSPGSKQRSATPARTSQIKDVKLMEEKLSGYLLSYGDAPTFVYQAHTEGTGSDLRYVTIVAQRDAQGEPAVAMHAVTDATHLDRTARLRLIDAVDVEASNRASLLFEMRGMTSRQFGIYRILGQHSDQIFSTGTMQ